MNAEKRMDDSKLQAAEDMVTGSIDRIEQVMEDLTGKVEQTSQKIQHVVDLGARQKEEFMHLKERAQETVVPLLRQGRDYGRQIMTQAKENRDPLLYGALALSIGWLAYRLLTRGFNVSQWSSSSSFSGADTGAGRSQGISASSLPLSNTY